MATITPSSIDREEAENDMRRLFGPPPVFKFWSPPKDPDKPRLPYIPGFTVQIRRHVPPPPFGGRGYGMGPREALSQRYLEGITQSELVMDHPSLDTPLPALSETARLTVTTPISIGAVRGTQVVACEISTEDEGGNPFQAVAKIYDPMYYSFDWDYSRQPGDTVWQADGEYSREAAAYEHIQKNMTSFAPKYFGSWTFDLPITSKGVPRTRPVRMILIERLDGMSMRNMRVRNSPHPEETDDAFHYPEDYRLKVLATAMDGYVRMLHSGLDQRYFASRNVMLVANTKPSAAVPVISGLPLPRIVLVDYTISNVYGLTSEGNSQLRRTPLPINPMQLWWGLPLNDFVGWVPHEWHSMPRLKQEWLKKRFGGTEYRKLYTMDEEPQFEDDSDEGPGTTGFTSPTHATPAKGPADTSRPQRQASDCHYGNEDTYNPPVLGGWIPYNTRSAEGKAWKAEMDKQGKGESGRQQALPVQKAGDEPSN